MRRLPIMINKPVRAKSTRYRPGASQVMDEAELIELAETEVQEGLASRKIGSGRVVPAPAARAPDPLL